MGATGSEVQVTLFRRRVSAREPRDGSEMAMLVTLVPGCGVSEWIARAM